jgi:hypothetical protein
MIPLYGFLHGDTMGLLMLADPEEAVASLAAKLVQAAMVRVAPRARVDVVFQGHVVDPKTTVRGAGMGALDRFDVVPREEASP